MAAEITIDKKTVSVFLAEGKRRQYLIPEYQRPYAWGDDQVITLFEDIWEFATTIGGYDHEDATYFLGSIVSFDNNEKNVVEIIDGQQRLTSLCLLLRAIYTKFEPHANDNKEDKRLVEQIEPALWRVNPRDGAVDKTRPLFRSDVVSDGGNEIIQIILQTGKVVEGAKDNYSRNYRKFQSLLDEASKTDPLNVRSFVFALLNQAIVLPITADSQDTALTIFSTLNNRGLPLSDADIFKAKIYSHLQLTGDDAKKKLFISDWKSLEERSDEAGESMQSLFYYDMFFERAKAKDQKTATPGVRNYFLNDNANRLFDAGLMARLEEIMTLFELVNNGTIADDEPWMSDSKILPCIDILRSYSNEFWKYPVIIYFLKHHKSNNFAEAFYVFLKRFIAFLLLRYLEMPTISAIKGDVLKLDAAIIDSDKPTFAAFKLVPETLRESIIKPHPKIIRMLLKIIAYNAQSKLLPKSWDIEHILPQKWDVGFFPNVGDDIVKEKIEHIGNKVPFETVKNIRASNGFFAKKQELYRTSAIKIVRDLCNYPKWDLGAIEVRDVQVSDEIMKTLQSWIEEYDRGAAI